MKHKKKTWKIVLISIVLPVFLYFLPIPDFIAFKISLGGSYKGSAVGIAGITPPQYYRFLMLDKFSSTKKSESLYRNHDSPAVKCYTFKALLNRSEVNHFELLKEGMFDERILSAQFGCIGGRSMVGDILINECFGMISVSDSLLLDSILLYSNTGLYSKMRLLRRIEPNESYYNRIHELTWNKSFPEAIVALAKYQRLIDTTMILSAKSDIIDPYYFLLAVKNFPDESFKDDLLEIHQKCLTNEVWLPLPIKRVLYKAMARYNCPEIEGRFLLIAKINDSLRNPKFDENSAEIMRYKDYFRKQYKTNNLFNRYELFRDLKMDIDDHCRCIYHALLEFNNPYYDEIKPAIKLDDWVKEEIEQNVDYLRYFK